MHDRMNMRIDQVDARGRRLGRQVTRRRVFEVRANFRVVHILLFNDRGELLLQQISTARSRHPQYWGSSVAGYLSAGETYAQAARRKLRTELGIEEVSLKFVGETSMLDDGCKKFIGVFSATYNGPLAPNPDDFASLWFMRRSEIARRIKGGVLHFTPTFLHVFAYLQKHRAS
jgi:isopentenyldiphosphate isomerase